MAPKLKSLVSPTSVAIAQDSLVAKEVGAEAFDIANQSSVGTRVSTLQTTIDQGHISGSRLAPASS